MKSRSSPRYNYSVEDSRVESDCTYDPKAFYNDAQRKFESGREKEAIKDCTKAIDLNPNYLEAYRLRRMIFLRLGKQEEAALDDQEIQRLEAPSQFKARKERGEPKATSSDDPNVFYERAIQNFQKGDYQEAILSCNRAIRLNPDYLDAYKLRRKICLSLGYKAN